MDHCLNAHLGKYDPTRKSGKIGDDITKIDNLATITPRLMTEIARFKGNLDEIMVDFCEAPTLYNAPVSKLAR